jgi:glutathione synthase/RimK-type ligase-like ATP-grasp enzyme
MKILIVTNDVTVPTYQRLIEECHQINIETLTLNPDSISQVLPFAPDHDLLLNRYTAVMGSDLDLDLLASVDQSRCVNEFNGLRICRSKLAQQTYLQQVQQNIIPSYFIQGQINLPSVIEFLRVNGDIFITKPIRGNGGRGITLFESQRSLISYLETCHSTRDQNFIIQPYLESRFELRVFMLNYSPYLIIKKMGEFSGLEFRKNLSRINDIQLINAIELKQSFPTLLAQCEKLSHDLKLKLCAFDIIIDSNGTFKFLEINAVPGWSYLEKHFKNDRNITREILKHIIE